MNRLTLEEFAQLAQEDGDYFWFESAFSDIAKAFTARKMGHGLLLVAPEASGKAIFTAKLCQSILCNSNSVVADTGQSSSNVTIGQACLKCKACRLFASGSHPDFYYIDRELNKSQKVKQNIAIDQIRDLTDKLSSTAQLSGWRIGVIASVEKMSRGAFNALLKSLEEPGNNTLLLLQVNQYYRVPQTIRSRCQKLTLDLNIDKLVPWLMAKTQCHQKTAENALLHTENAPLAALDFIKSGSAEDYKKLSRDLDALVLNRLSPQAVFTRHKKLEEAFWRYLTNYLKDVQLALLSIDKTQDLTQDEALSIYAKLPKTSLFELYDQLVDYHRGQCGGSNLQFQLQIEAILTQWFEIGRKIVHYSNHTH